MAQTLVPSPTKGTRPESLIPAPAATRFGVCTPLGLTRCVSPCQHCPSPREVIRNLIRESQVAMGTWGRLDMPMPARTAEHDQSRCGCVRGSVRHILGTFPDVTLSAGMASPCGPFLGAHLRVSGAGQSHGSPALTPWARLCAAWPSQAQPHLESCLLPRSTPHETAAQTDTPGGRPHAPNPASGLQVHNLPRAAQPCCQTPLRQQRALGGP